MARADWRKRYDFNCSPQLRQALAFHPRSRHLAGRLARIVRFFRRHEQSRLSIEYHGAVEVVKLTSIASVVALPEPLYSADLVRSVTLNSSPIACWPPQSILLCCGRSCA